MNDLKHATLFVNGQLEDPGALRLILKPASLWIAVDGGLTHLRRLGLEPDVVIGDLDSVEPGDLTYLEPFGIKVLQYPPAKDETDLELALTWAAAQPDVTEIVVLGALGGRPDQTLANLLLLALPALAGREVIIADGAWTVRCLRGGETATFHGQPGDTLSLLPLGGDAVGVTTGGLAYPLRDETLHFGFTRGVSNEFAGETATVSLQTGLLWCLHQGR